jgi:pimeloyl-ACP methyl ester carboxylesterase
MGIGGQLVMWDDEFCAKLAARGFKVIRFDNRDVGESSKLDQLGVQKPADVVKKRVLRQPLRPEYTLEDMAADTAGLIAHLGYDSAHILGMSLGGMVAQCLALNHPEKVRSLTLIMTNPGALWTHLPTPTAFKALTAKPGKTREAAIERSIGFFKIIGGGVHDTPAERLALMSGRQFDRGQYPRGFARQYAAVVAARSRLSRLRKLRVPTLVVHGAEDPLVRPLGGRLLAAAIPGALFSLIRGMGHDLGPSMWSHLIDRVVENKQRHAASLPAGPQLGALIATPITLR